MSTALDTSAPSSVVRKLDLPTLPDGMLGDYRAAVLEHAAEFKAIAHRIDAEFERRLRERGAREIAHPKFDKIALEDQWSAYTADYPALLEAQRLLKAAGKDEDAAKIVKHIAEQVTVVEAHLEYGAAVSIAALIRKYGDESEIGQLLLRGLSRTALGSKIVVKPKPGAR